MNFARNPEEASPTATQTVAPDVAERVRLAALHRLKLLDSPDSKAFDRVTRLTAAALRVPIVLVSLVDEKRQWFKSRVGLDATETPRAISFCAHAVIDRSPLVVPDATQDIRFAGNPMVTGAPHVRAYAGIPLYTADGHAIGALCAIDRRARIFTPAELNTLRDAARAIEECIAAEDSSDEGALPAAASDAEVLFEQAFLHAAVGLAHMSLKGKLLRANPCLCKMLGYRADEIIGMTIADFTHPEDIDSSQGLLDQMAVGAITSQRLDKRYMRRDGTTWWGTLLLAAKKSSSGRPDFLVAAVEDITTQKQAELDVAQLRDGLQADVEQQTRESAEIMHALRSHIRRRVQFEQEAGRHAGRASALPGAGLAYVSYWNRQLRCEFVNDAYCARFDCAPEQLVGMTMEEIFGAAFAEIQLYARLALDGHEQCVGHPIVLRTGQRMHDLRLVPERIGPSQVEGLYLIFTGQRPRQTLESVAG
jgi:PAS domain S-box-containing protein